MWHLGTGKLLASIMLEWAVTGVAVSADGRSVVAGDAGGNLYCFVLLS